MVTSVISRWGNGQGLHLSRKLLDSLGWKVGDTISFIVKEDGKVELRNDSAEVKRIGVAKGKYRVPPKEELEAMDAAIASLFGE